MESSRVNREIAAWSRDVLLVMAVLVGALCASGRAEDAAGPAVPAGIPGDWVQGSISPTTFWDKRTGQFQGNARGMASYLSLAADGTYREYVYIETRMYNMTTQIWTTMQGTYTADASSITFTPATGHYKTAGTRTIDRPMEPSELAEKVKTYRWHIERSERDDKEHLIFPFEDGSRFDYTPVETTAMQPGRG